MFSIAICDDESIFCQNLKEKLNKYSFFENNEFELTIYTDYKNLVKDIENLIEYDLLFLDIELGDSDGIEIGKYLRRKFNIKKLEIIYVSGKATYAIDLFKNRPFDFLIKPITDEKLFSVMTSYFKQCDENEYSIIFKFKSILHRVMKDKIMFIKSDKRIITVYSNQKTYICYDKLTNFVNILNDSKFIRIHKSYAVNAEYIEKFSRSDVVLINGIELPISQQYLKKARSEYLKFMGDKFE